MVASPAAVLAMLPYRIAFVSAASAAVLAFSAASSLAAALAAEIAAASFDENA